MADPMNADLALSKVERAALRWWRMRRPITWSEAGHLRSPTVGTTTPSETALANACARLVTERKKRGAR